VGSLEVPDGNHKKGLGYVIPILTGLILLGVAAVFTQAQLANRDQNDHEKDVEAHPIIQQQVEILAEDVTEIKADVKGMREAQIQQTVILEQIGEDIGELKEAAP
jgi:hypothetical protein